MSQAAFYPYPVAQAALHLDCAVDDERVVVENQRVLLQGISDGDKVEIVLELHMDDGTLSEVLPAGELDEPPVKVLVLAKGIAARTRQALELERADGVWTGHLELRKSDFYQVVQLEPVLARTSAGTDDAYATHPGARLAWGTPVEVEFDDLPIPPGGYLEIKWDDFKTSDNHYRKQNPDLYYLLDTDASPPMLWLNSGAHEDFKAVMHAAGPRGRNMRVRDAMYDTIVSQAWTSLVSILLMRLASAMAEEDDVDAAIESLSEWETQVLHHWADVLEPDAGTKAEAIRDVVESAASHDLMPALQDRLGAAVQRQSRTAHAFQGLIRLRDSEGV